MLLAVVLFVAGLLLGISIGYESWRDARYPVGVVKAGTVALRMGNGETYPPVLENGVAIRLHAGVEFRVRTQRPNAWLQVELGSGQIGWIREADVLLDTPRAAAPLATGLGR